MLRQIAMLGLALPLTFAIVGCDVDVKDEGELPDVDVEPGRMPDVDVKGPDIDIGTKEKEITVPDVDLEKKKITVPDIDVDIPNEEDNEPVKPPASPPSP